MTAAPTKMLSKVLVYENLWYFLDEVYSGHGLSQRCVPEGEAPKVSRDHPHLTILQRNFEAIWKVAQRAENSAEQIDLILFAVEDGLYQAGILARGTPPRFSDANPRSARPRRVGSSDSPDYC